MEYLTYTAAVGGGSDSMEMRYEDENIWLTQKMMAALYDVDVRTINYHIQKIFEDSELAENSVIRNFRITATDGKNYNTKHYNLQMIIAVGFKVNNERAVQFRKWAGQIVKDYTIQGWTMDAERLVSMYLDYAEEQAERKIPMSMEDWAKRLDGFLEFNGHELLIGPGKISAEQAKLHAETEFEKYRIVQDRLFQSDFDRYLLDSGESKQ